MRPGNVCLIDGILSLIGAEVTTQQSEFFIGFFIFMGAAAICFQIERTGGMKK